MSLARQSAVIAAKDLRLEVPEAWHPLLVDGPLVALPCTTLDLPIDLEDGGLDL